MHINVDIAVHANTLIERVLLQMCIQESVVTA